MKTVKDVIAALVNDTITIDNSEQYRINNIINEAHQQELNNGLCENVEDFADNYDCGDDYRDQVVADIMEEWGVER